MNIKEKFGSRQAISPTPLSVSATRYTPSPKRGLTKLQVDARISEGLTNHAAEDTAWSTGQIVRANLLTYFNLIFFVLAIVLLAVGSFNNLTFLVVVFVNSVIGIFQEIKSKKTLENLKLVTEPETLVIRDGKAKHLPNDQLVLDDIVVFQAGNQICADAIVCSGEITVNESLVTGESDEIRKAAGDTLLSGSFVISGRAFARLDKVGEEAFAVQLAKDAKKIKKKSQPGMMRSLTRLIQIIGIIIIPFAGLMFWNQYQVLELPIKVSVENTAASIIGMIPEGLYLLTSVALAASTIRLAKKETLVHDMKCIETLARVDVLCVDKTGTITEPQMNVDEVIPLNGAKTEIVKTQLTEFVRAMNADNETMKALKFYCGNPLPGNAAVRMKGFSSATKYSAVDFGSKGSFLIGAPDVLLKNGPVDLEEMASSHASQGARVLLFAQYSFEKGQQDDIFDQGTLGEGLAPIAMILLSNAIRPQAKETFQYFSDQGVAIKVISGDNPVTAAIAAQKAGIDGAEQYIDASTLTTKEEIEKALTRYTVFGRVTPDQKRQIVQALKKSGHTVAMTGDGVNDVLALKDADCSIAMASGSDAAAQVSDLVLLNSDFSGMPHVVAEGRRVINNIQRSASLFLVKNIFSFLLSLISLISVSLYPLKPAQISLVSALMIGVPSFFLALEPNHEIVKGKFLRNVLFRAFPAALTAVILVEWSILFTNAFEIETAMASTIAFYLYALSAYLMLFRVCRPISVWHGILFGAMGAAFVLATIFIPEWFQISRLDYQSLLIISPLFLLTIPIDHALHVSFRKVKEWKNRAIAYFKKKEIL